MNAPLENISAVKVAVTRWEVILVPAPTDLGLTVTALPATVRNDQKWREKKWLLQVAGALRFAFPLSREEERSVAHASIDSRGD